MLRQPRIHASFEEDVLKNLPSKPPEDIKDHWTIFSTVKKDVAHNNIPKVERKKTSTYWFTRLEILGESSNQTSP